MYMTHRTSYLLCMSRRRVLAFHFWHMGAKYSLKLYDRCRFCDPHVEGQTMLLKRASHSMGPSLSDTVNIFGGNGSGIQLAGSQAMTTALLDSCDLPEE